MSIDQATGRSGPSLHTTTLTVPGAVPQRMGRRSVRRAQLSRSSSFRDLRETDQPLGLVVPPPALQRRNSMRRRRVTTEPVATDSQLSKIKPTFILEDGEYMELSRLICQKMTPEEIKAVPLSRLIRFCDQAIHDLEYMMKLATKVRAEKSHLRKEDQEVIDNKLEGQLRSYDLLAGAFKECRELFISGLTKVVSKRVSASRNEDGEEVHTLNVTSKDKVYDLVKHWILLVRYMEQWRVVMPSPASLMSECPLPDMKCYKDKSSLTFEEKVLRLKEDATQMHNNWKAFNTLVKTKSIAQFHPIGKKDLSHKASLPNELKLLPPYYQIPRDLYHPELGEYVYWKSNSWAMEHLTTPYEKTEKFPCDSDGKVSEATGYVEEAVYQGGAEAIEIPVSPVSEKPRPENYFMFQPVATHGFGKLADKGEVITGKILQSVSILEKQVLATPSMEKREQKELQRLLKQLEESVELWQRSLPSLQQAVDRVVGSQLLEKIKHGAVQVKEGISESFMALLPEKKKKLAALGPGKLKRHESEKGFSSEKLKRKLLSVRSLPDIPFMAPTIPVPDVIVEPASGSASDYSEGSSPDPSSSPVDSRTSTPDHRAKPESHLDPGSLSP